MTARKRWRKLATACVLIVIAGAPATMADDGQGRAIGLERVQELRASFNSEMKRPLADRVPGLQRLRAQIKSETVTGEHHEALPDYMLLLFETERQLAEQDEAAKTFGRFAAAKRQAEGPQRARKAVLEVVRRRWMAGELAETETLAEAAATALASDAESMASLLYMRGRAVADQIGRTENALPLFKRIIAEFPDSEVRPQALRSLAHLQANGYGGGEKAALATLALMEEQYRGTWWEQYAHMKPAVIWEIRKGEPQKALSRYEETLKRFPDHRFATYCRRQIERLQYEIEQQLIRDALDGLGAAEEAGAKDAVAAAEPMVPSDDALVMWQN